jgi:mannose-1-phosphate guanylyltransferase
MDNNVIQGKVIINNTENCYIRSDSKIVCCSDVDDLVIVEEKDVILVMKKNKSQNVKKLVEIVGKKDATLR